MTQIVKDQKKTFVKVYTKDGIQTEINVNVRYDDTCGNGYNSFRITCAIIPKGKQVDGGMQHKAVAEHFPNLIPFLKWHGCSTDGPSHYVANTVYHVEQGNLDYARSTAVWPEATDEDLLQPNLCDALQARLPALLVEFQTAVESLGFTY